MKYLITPEEYKLANPRIDGWKKLREVGARTVDIFVFPLEVFKYYQHHHQLPQDFIKEVVTTAEKIINKSVSHTAVVRRAFMIPHLKNPPGPRFLGLTTTARVVKAIEKLFQFAIDQKYYQVPGSQISGWLEPPSTVLDTKKFNDNPESINIPYGGYALSENGRVEIYAVFGINEGVQSLVTDRYLIEFHHERIFILKKEMPQKNLMLCTTKKSGAQLFNVPISIQFDQILSDAEIIEVARVVHELSKKYGPQRVEFSTDEKGICFNEVADYWKEDTTKNKAIRIQGEVLKVDDINDLAKLTKIKADKLKKGKYIISIGQNIITDRNYDILGSIAAWKDNLYVLYPGVAATQHAVRVLADKGHRAFLVGNQKFSEGDKVQITTIGGKIRVTNLSKTESQKIVSLWDASLLGIKLCGGKATSLSKLRLLGFQIPHGSVLTTIVFDEIIKKLGFNSPVKIKDFSRIKKALEKPSEEILAMIDDLLTDYRNSSKFFAVRSSATIEDHPQQSLAGMFETFLNIPGHKLTEKVIAVFRSTFAAKVINYLKNNPQLIYQLKMAVTIQRMVPARVAGVIFGAKIQTGDFDIVEIEASLGLGEEVVSGQAKEIDQYRYSRRDKKIIERKGPKILSLPEAKALFLLSERLRAEFSDIPQDIEWAIDQNGQMWILQSRDLYIPR